MCSHLFFALILLGSPGVQTAAQKPAATQEKPKPSPVKPEDLPVSLERIQKALANTPRLRFDKDDRPVFRTEVFGEKPTIDDILGPDWEKGPVKQSGMTHQEFLRMVTPQDLQGYGGLTNSEGATIAATSTRRSIAPSARAATASRASTAGRPLRIRSPGPAPEVCAGRRSGPDVPAQQLAREPSAVGA